MIAENNKQSGESLTAPGKIHIGRQPIYDWAMELVGYELFHRQQSESPATDTDLATTQVLVNAFMEFGLEELVGSAPAHINITQAFCRGDYPLPPPPEQVVLEVSNRIEPTREVVQGLGRLKADGYVIALERFEFSETSLQLLDYADIVSIDIAHTDAQQLPDIVRRLQGYPIRLMAKRIDDPEQLERCKELGFDLFQGNALGETQTLSTRPLPNNRPGLVHLLNRIEDPKSHVSELEELLRRDITLSYRLLRYVNCATFSLRRELDSVQQVIMQVGLVNIKDWLRLMLISRVDHATPRSLITTALTRARMCELMAAEHNFPRTFTEQAFTTGLFSMLDKVLEIDMADIIDMLPLAYPIKETLLDGSGELGELLAQATGCEKGGDDQDDPQRLQHYIGAAKWAEEASSLFF